MGSFCWKEFITSCNEIRMLFLVFHFGRFYGIASEWVFHAYRISSGIGNRSFVLGHFRGSGTNSVSFVGLRDVGCPLLRLSLPFQLIPLHLTSPDCLLRFRLKCFHVVFLQQVNDFAVHVSEVTQEGLVFGSEIFRLETVGWVPVLGLAPGLIVVLGKINLFITFSFLLLKVYGMYFNFFNIWSIPFFSFPFISHTFNSFHFLNSLQWIEFLKFHFIQIIIIEIDWRNTKSAVLL